MLHAVIRVSQKYVLIGFKASLSYTCVYVDNVFSLVFFRFLHHFTPDHVKLYIHEIFPPASFPSVYVFLDFCVLFNNSSFI